jgi:DNA-binding transcriptional MocR family regulator
MTTSWEPKIKSSGRPLYLAIVDALAEDIATGALPAETRLPTHRDLAEQMGVAIGTITRAYIEAEKLGLIHSEGRRGTLVGRAGGRSPALVSLLEPDSSLVDLARYAPSVTEDPDLLLALRQLSRRAQARWLLQYVPSAGLAHHREAGAAWIGRLGLQADPASIVVTSGAQHALTVILALIAQRGDVILAESHTYPGVRSVTDLLGLEMVGVPIDGDGILPDDLESICRSRKVRALYCSPTFQNPTNVIVSEGRRRAIAEIASRHGVLVIEDAINRALVPDPPPLIASLIPDLCFLVASVSKAVAAGLRVCFVKTPSGWESKLADTVRTTVLTLPPLTLEIFAQWMGDGTVDETVRRRRNEGRARQQLAAEVFPGRNIGSQPTSYFLWLQMGDVWTANRFALEARNRGISVAPARMFAVDEAQAQNAVRLCLGGTVTRPALRSALETLADILNKPPQGGFPTV